MKLFEITMLRGNSVWALYRMRERIQLDPEYQRLSDIWTDDQRMLLVDTVLNDFDIPKIYLHKFQTPRKHGPNIFDYAIVDGKQRLETLWSFVEGKFSLADDFKYFEDPSVKAASMTYSELGREHPDLKVQFDNFPLSVVCIETNDLGLIEEMFTRLNEAATLTAPEKRNAFGGPMPRAIRKLAKGEFFTKSLPFRNDRYRHFDLAVKFLLAEKEEKVVDTKKVYLDEFVYSFATESRDKMPIFLKPAQRNCEKMAEVFTHNDPLLRQVGMVMLYYHLFRIAGAQGWLSAVTRSRLAEFNELRAKNRQKAEKDLAKASYDLLEFDRYTQAPNDGYALRLRLQILLRRVFAKNTDIDKL